MIKYIKVLLLFSNIWAIGYQGLVIPQNGEILSNAGTGIAGNIDPVLNPAMQKIDVPYIQYSLNKWLGDLSGSYTLFRWGKTVQKQVSIQTWNANDIPLYGDSPSTYPIGQFGVHWTSAAFSLSHHFNTPYIFGLRLQTSYSHLFTESLSALTLDLGTFFPINNMLSIAGVMRNIGYEFNNNIKANLPLEYGLGINCEIPFLKSSLLSDILYNKSNGEEKRLAFVTNWKIFNINVGKSIAEKRNANSLGFSFNYRRWKINYGVYFHENSTVLGMPRFLDVRCYL